MRERLRVNVAEPCGEEWGKMLPVEQGRHCQQCCKTVVDFTAMSDAELLRFFKERAMTGAGRGPDAAGVCGRFMADQLGRELAPMPVQRNGFKGWPLVVAGALALGKGADSARRVTMGKPARHEVPMPGAMKAGPDTSRPVVTTDTPAILTGVMIVNEEPKSDVIGEIPADSLAEEMPADTMVITGDTTICSGKPMDTVSRIRVMVDSLVDQLKDTIAVVVPVLKSVLSGSQRVQLLKVYPNPVSRGGTIRIAWRSEAGSYSIALFSSAGLVLGERVMTVGAKGQVDEWTLPPGLAAGVYFLRAGRLGEEVWTTKILVQ